MIERRARVSAPPGDPAGDLDGVGPHVAGIDQHLDPCVGGMVQGGGEHRVEVMAGAEGVAIGTLDREQHHRPVALGDHGLKLTQMPGAAGRHAVGELGQRPLAPIVAVLIMGC